jgi:hypothetical protein
MAGGSEGQLMAASRGPDEQMGDGHWTVGRLCTSAHATRNSNKVGSGRVVLLQQCGKSETRLPRVPRPSDHTDSPPQQPTFHRASLLTPS